MLTQGFCSRKFIPTYVADLALLGCRYLGVSFFSMTLPQTYYHYAIFRGSQGHAFVQSFYDIYYTPLSSQF